MIGVDPQQVINSVLAGVEQEIAKGDTFAPVRWAEYCLAAYRCCTCGEHSCGGCAVSLHLATKLEHLFPATATDQQIASATNAAVRHWLTEDARVLQMQSDVTRRTREWAEKQAEQAQEGR